MDPLCLPSQYHKGYLERCKYHGDEAGVGSAYEALSRSFERYVMYDVLLILYCGIL